MNVYYEYQIVYDSNPRFLTPSIHQIIQALTRGHDFEMLFVSFGASTSCCRTKTNRFHISLVSVDLESSRNSIANAINKCLSGIYVLNPIFHQIIAKSINFQKDIIAWLTLIRVLF